MVYQLFHWWEVETHFGSEIQKTPDQNLGFIRGIERSPAQHPLYFLRTHSRASFCESAIWAGVIFQFTATRAGKGGSKHHRDPLVGFHGRTLLSSNKLRQARCLFLWSTQRRNFLLLCNQAPIVIDYSTGLFYHYHGRLGSLHNHQSLFHAIDIPPDSPPHFQEG